MSRALIEKLVDAMNKHGSPYLGHIEEYQAALTAAREYLAQPNTQEPVLYQSRMRPAWKDDADWFAWEVCSRESAEAYERTPLLHDWQYQVRRLYAEPSNGVKP